MGMYAFAMRRKEWVGKRIVIVEKFHSPVLKFNELIFRRKL